MRAWEILENRQPRSKPVTLGNLNKLKHDQRVRERAGRKRRVLIPIMYGDAKGRREQLELLCLELD